MHKVKEGNGLSALRSGDMSFRLSEHRINAFYIGKSIDEFKAYIIV